MLYSVPEMDKEAVKDAKIMVFGIDLGCVFYIESKGLKDVTAKNA